MRREPPPNTHTRTRRLWHPLGNDDAHAAHSRHVTGELWEVEPRSSALVISKLEHKIAGKPLLGLFLTAGAALAIANLVPLASAGFLIIFAAVNMANVRLADRTQSHKAMSILGAAACVGALIALLAHIATDRPQDLVLLGGLLTLTYAGEATYQHRRRLRPLANQTESP